MQKNKTTAIILAAGSGKRMNLLVTKQRLTVAGESILKRTLRAFDACEDVDFIVLVTRADEMDFAKEESSEISKLCDIVVGGEVRAESAAIGFSRIPEQTAFVAIHDGARCLITPKMISAVISDAKKYGAATAAARVTDTVKKIDRDGNILTTCDRDFLVTVQTPQVFKTELYKEAVSKINVKSSAITDDNMLMENIGVAVHCTDVGKTNIKITHRSDIRYAEFILSGGDEND